MDKVKLFESILDFKKDIQGVASYAKEKHDATKAVRKHSGDPYWVHPEGVAKIAIAFDLSDDEVKAAALHDTLEDTDASWEEIKDLAGEEVADIVSELTNDNEMIARFGKEDAMNAELINLSNKALNVKLCDFYYNLMDYPSQQQKTRMINNLKWLKRNRNLTDTQRWIIKDCLQEL